VRADDCYLDRLAEGRPAELGHEVGQMPATWRDACRADIAYVAPLVSGNGAGHAA
jgi:hypothetical protein